ncbi:MAG TPA: helicase [Candidatus Hydrogenedentes bacterium]|nr:helicase [Candidatus Hydrogenedentota bacterium]HNT88262.1 helicase [Candidatus Hydrogenedentota bacterium]
MPKLNSFTLRIRTGEHGLSGTPQYGINGFTLDFDEVEGGAGPGETLEVTGSPESFPHSPVLVGPEEGRWDIEGVDATYHCAGETPYTVRLGAVSLDAASDLNIWHARPERVFDV